MMNYSEFLDRLRSTPRVWYLDSGAIRRGTPNAIFCPGLVLGIFDIVAGDVWLKRFEIVAAADNTKKHNPTVRRDLLEACGLTE